MTESLIHSFDDHSDSMSMTLFAVFLALAVTIGGALGYVINMKLSGGGANQVSNAPAKKTVGVTDEKTFTDKAEGVLRDGGIEDEGTFHLERSGGASQNVYLTSSTVDLSQYIGKRVRVHGATQTAKKAGWLMEVGLVEIL